MFFLFILTGVGITYFYSDKVEKLVVDALNDQLQRPVKFSQLEFSFFSKFPKASVEILDVQVAGLTKKDSPFVQAEKIYLAFDLYSLMEDDIVINEISVENATVNVEVDKNGAVNYEIFKSGGESKKSNILNIESVHLVNVKLNYNDVPNKLFIAGHSYNSSVKVSLSSTQNISCSWNGMIAELKTSSQNFFNIPLKANLKVKVSSREITYSVLEGDIGNAKLSLDGIYNKTKSLNNTNFTFTTNDFKSLASFLDKQLVEDLSSIKSIGSFEAKGSLTDINKKQSTLKVDFRLKEGKVALKNEEYLSNINIQGDLNWQNISYNSTAVLSLKEFSLNLGESTLNGKGSLKDFSNLKVQLDLTGSADIASLVKGFSNGGIKVNFNEKDKNFMYIFQNKDLKVLNYIQSSGDIQVEDLSFSTSAITDEFTAIFGKITFDKQRVLLEDMKGKVNGSSFVLNGSLLNYLESILEDKALEISAGITIDKVNLEEFINETNSGEKADGYFLDIPSNLNLNLDLQLGAFSFRNFEAKNISGNVKLRDKLLQLSNIVFLSCEGKNVINGTLDAQYENQLTFESKLNLTGIDVKKAFYQLENFGQTFLLDKHVSGKLSTDLYFKIVSDKALNIKEDLLFVQASILLKDGELNQFEPMLELEKFLKDEFKISMALGELKFNTLGNVIEIKDRNITIPEMRIESSGINLDVAGTHTFDQEINYLFKIKNGEIFKAKNRNKIDAKYGVVDNGDQTSTLPLLMTGTVDNPKFSYDFRTKKEIVKNNWKEEGKDVKEALKQEIKEILGRDSVPKEEKSNVKIKVVWDEE